MFQLADCTSRENLSAQSSCEAIKASIVIPAYNAAGTIGKVITSCLHQDFGMQFEVIAIDDGSRDGTWAAISEFADHENVIGIQQTNLGVSAARNAGADVASGEVLVFCDADIIVPPEWLRRLIEAALEPNAGLIGCVYAPAEGLPLITSCTHEDIRRRQMTGPDTPLHIGSFTMALRRSLFESVGGFDVEFIRAQDTELSYRIAEAGCQSRILKDLAVRHEHHRALYPWLVNQGRQAFWRTQMLTRRSSTPRGDGYTSWRDWGSLVTSAAVLETAPLAFVGSLWIVPAVLTGAFAALQIPPTAYAIGDTGDWRHIVMIPIQMLRSVAWLAGAAAGILYLSRANDNKSREMKGITDSTAL